MARQTSLTSLKQISEINLTPLMDLTFLLLITFIITFPLIEQGIPVNLPKGKANVLSPDTAQTVTLNHEGALFLDDVAVSSEELGARMASLAKADPSLMVMVRADERIPYGDVARVLKVLHKAEVRRLALVTQEE